jgi:rod shape-determining protein MreC
MRRYLLIILIAFLLGGIYLTNFFIKKERFFDENSRLKQENENLKAQIQKSQSSIINCSSSIAYGPSLLITAKVFSTYPFNVKNKITVNVGKKQDIKEMMVVAVGENLLVGQVVEIFENYSVIRTVFDPEWQLPVRIGREEVNGLLKGGNEPKVTLIEKEKAIQLGDIVYSASQEFLYGLKIGEVGEIKETSAGVFKEAVLKIPFNVGELREVQILK